MISNLAYTGKIQSGDLVINMAIGLAQGYVGTKAT